MPHRRLPITARMDLLISDDYTIQRFADLPTPYQLAIVWHMAVDGEAWDGVDLSSLSWSDPKPGLLDLLPKYVDLYGDTRFGTSFLGTEAVQNSVMRDAEISEDYGSWEEYHAAYLSAGAPKHPESDRWPVILSDDDSETLHDGWRRFHSYVRDGAAGIPSVFFPGNHHLTAHQASRLSERAKSQAVSTLPSPERRL